MNLWSIPRAVRAVAIALVGAAVLIAAGVGPAATPGATRPTAVAASGVVYHGVNQTQLQQCIAKGENCLKTVPGLGQCLKTYRVCNQAGATNAGPWSRPVPSGTRLLTVAQALRSVGVPNATVKRDTVRLTTYGVLRREDPALAAQLTIAASRPVYLIRVWYTHPIVSNLPVPNGASATWYVIRSAYVIDAATGQVTDWSVTQP